MTEITETIARKVVEVVDVGLVQGVGAPIPGQMCVEAAVCFAMGLPHGDNPSCVAPTLRRLKIALNDQLWSSPQARAKGLRRLAVAQLGSAGVLDETAFRRRIVDMTIRRCVPIGLRAAAKVNPKYAAQLEMCAVKCETEGTRESCQEAQAAAYAASASAPTAGIKAQKRRRAAYAASAASASAAYASDASDAADAYAAYAASAASASAAYASDASDASDAADAYAADAAAASDAADAADAYAAEADRARDRVLAQYAEFVVEILVEMKAPGCQWLVLTPKEEAA